MKKLWIIVGSVVFVAALLIGGAVYAFSQWQTTQVPVSGSIVVTSFPVGGGTGTTGLVTSKTQAMGTSTTPDNDGNLLSIAVTPNTQQNLIVNQGLQYKAVGTYSVPNNSNYTQDITADVDWSSSDTTVASINSNGMAVGVASGTTRTTTISCSLQNDVTDNLITSNSVSLQVSNFAYSASSLSFGSNTVEVGQGLAIQGSITVTNTGNVPITGVQFSLSGLPSGMTIGAMGNVAAGNILSVSIPAGSSGQVTFIIGGNAPSTAQTIDLSALSCSITPQGN